MPGQGSLIGVVHSIELCTGHTMFVQLATGVVLRPVGRPLTDLVSVSLAVKPWIWRHQPNASRSYLKVRVRVLLACVITDNYTLGLRQYAIIRMI